MFDMYIKGTYPNISLIGAKGVTGVISGAIGLKTKKFKSISSIKFQDIGH